MRAERRHPATGARTTPPARPSACGRPFYVHGGADAASDDPTRPLCTRAPTRAQIDDPTRPLCTRAPTRAQIDVAKRGRAHPSPAVCCSDSHPRLCCGGCSVHRHTDSTSIYNLYAFLVGFVRRPPPPRAYVEGRPSSALRRRVTLVTSDVTKNVTRRD